MILDDKCTLSFAPLSVKCNYFDCLSTFPFHSRSQPGADLGVFDDRYAQGCSYEGKIIYFIF